MPHDKAEEMTTENRIKVLIVDDEPLARALIVELLKKFPEFQIVGECSDGREAIKALKRKSPDLVFLDVQIPGFDGFDVVARYEALGRFYENAGLEDEAAWRAWCEAPARSASDRPHPPGCK